MPRRGIEVIGHAGAAGFHPHNSLESIQKALALGVDRIEIDILSTSDDALVLVHDTKIAAHGRRGPVSRLSLEDVRVTIPGCLTIEDAHKVTSNRIPLILDIKGRHYLKALLEAVEAIAATDEVSASSTHASVLKALHGRFPAMSLGLSRGHSLTKVRSRALRGMVGRVVSVAMVIPTLAVAKRCGATELMIQHHTCTRLFVLAAHAFHLKVNVWTVDKPDDMRRMVRIGVDGIISNRPDLVFELLA